MLGCARGPALAVAAVVAVAAAVFLPQRRTLAAAALTERDYLIELDAPPGTSLPEMNRITGEISQRVCKAARGARGRRHAGRAITGDQVANVNTAEMWVGLDRSADSGRTVDGDADDRSPRTRTWTPTS